jgi:hypothetical protein
MFPDIQFRGCLAYDVRELPVSYILVTFKTITAGLPEIQAFGTFRHVDWYTQTFRTIMIPSSSGSSLRNVSNCCNRHGVISRKNWIFSCLLQNSINTSTKVLITTFWTPCLTSQKPQLIYKNVLTEPRNMRVMKPIWCTIYLQFIQSLYLYKLRVY